MTETTARAVSNAVLVTAGAAAAYVVLTRPALRRAAWRGLTLWLGASVPAYLLGQVRRAWVESGKPA